MTHPSDWPTVGPRLAEALEGLEDAAACLTATFGYIPEDYPKHSAMHTHEGHTEAYLTEMIGKARAALATLKEDQDERD